MRAGEINVVTLELLPGSLDIEVEADVKYEMSDCIEVSTLDSETPKFFPISGPDLSQ